MRSGDHYSLPPVRRVTVSPGSTVDLTLELELAQPAWLRIRAQKAAGSRPCASSMQLHLYPAIGVGAQLGRRQQAAFDAGTAAEIFAGIPYAFALDSPARACSTGAAAERLGSGDAAGREQTLWLPLCAAMVGRIISRSGSAGDSAVLLWPEAGAPSRFTWIAVLPDPAGNFEARCLPPGKYRALAVPLARWAIGEWEQRTGAALVVELIASGKTRVELAGPAPEVEMPEPRLARREPCNFGRWGLVTEPPVRINGWPGVPAGARCAASR